MDKELFKGYDAETRRRLLEDNCNAIELKNYTKRFNDAEREFRRKRNTEIDLELGVIKEDEEIFKEQIKARRKPLIDEKQKLLGEIKADGEYVQGQLYKFVDREEGLVGYYNSEGDLVESRKMTSADRQMSLQLRAAETGTDN